MTNESEHDWFREQIGAYLADGLFEDERARFESHARNCETCAAELERLREMDSGLSRTLADIQPPADFEDRLVKRLSMNLTARRRWIHPTVQRAAGAVAAAIVIGAVGLVGSEYLKHGRLPRVDSLAMTGISELRQRVGTASETTDKSNTNIHNEYGANVIYGDGHNEFHANPFVGVKRDADNSRRSSPNQDGPYDSNDSSMIGGRDGDMRYNKVTNGGAQSQPPAPVQNQPEATGVLNKIQEIDPDYHFGRGVKQLVEDNASILETREFKTKYEHQARAEAVVPYGDTLRFPTDWPKLPEERGATLERGKPVDDSAVNAKLDRKLPEVRFDEVALGDVVEFMRDVSGASIAVDWEALEKAGVKRDTPISAKMQNIKVADAIQSVLDQATGGERKLGLAVQNGVVAVAQANALQQPVADGAAVPQVRKVIREGVLEFEVDSFDTAFNTISTITAEEGGFIVAADSDRLENGKVRGAITVRVPPDRLDTLVMKLRGLGELKSQRLGSKDVSKHYTDLESELRAARAMEERLLELIKTGKGEVKDLLAAEKELGEWRTKIEKIQGQIKYYDNLVSMATLTINAYERDIRTPASAAQAEEINAGLETEDVEHARAELIKAIDEAKGRIIESELKQLEAGQLGAKIVAEVAPEHAGPIVDRLRQLGVVARLDIQRKQTDSAPRAATSTTPARVEEAPTRLIFSIYNLANVAPKLTTTLNLSAEDVETTYRGILRRVAESNGRVLASNLSQQNANQSTGTIQFELKSADADAILAEIRGDAKVQVLQLGVSINPGSANVTSAKQGFSISIIPATAVAPRETRSISVQTSDVEQAAQRMTQAVNSAGGRILESNLSQDAGGKTVARLTVEVPLAQADPLIDQARQQGKVRTAESSKSAAVPEGPLARARLTMTIGSGDAIVPSEGGFWDTIRDGLSTSFKGLMWSLQLIIIGLCLLGPWVLLIWGGVRLMRNRRRSTA